MERCASGAIFTAFLFMLGQYLIGLYIQYTAQGSAYGAAGSIIVILVWIYYTSAILYIGAEFTQVYAEAPAAVSSLLNMQFTSANRG